MLTKDEAAQRLLQYEEERRQKWLLQHPDPPRKRSLFRRLMWRVQPPSWPRFLARFIYRLRGEVREEDFGPPPEVAILDEFTTETWYGWVFRVESEEYMRTRDERNRLLGSGPTVVLKNTGEVFPLGTGWDWDGGLARFEQSLATPQNRTSEKEQET